MAILYRHIRIDKNEVFYVGIGKSQSRAYDKRQRNRYWNHITSITPYQVEILFEDLTWEQAQEKEREFIKLYGRKDLGLGTLVNLTDGGDGQLNARRPLSACHKEKFCQYWLGKNLSEDTKKKMSEASKGKTKTSEHRENISTTLKGLGKGISKSEATKAKMSEAKTGLKHTQATKDKLSIINQGKKQTEEVRQRMSEAQRLRWAKLRKPA